MSLKSFTLHLGLGLKKNLPTALVIGGIATGVAAGIIAVMKTPKLYEVTKEDKESLKRIKENLEDPSARAIINQGDVDDEPVYVPYDEKLYKEDKNKIIRNMVKNTVVTYSVPAGMAVAAITMILLGYRMKCKALVMMTAAFNSTMAAFNTYRGRVVERFGAEVDNDIMLGKETEIVEAVDEDGNITAEEKTVVKPIGLFLQYDKTWSTWRNDPSTLRWELSVTQTNACTLYKNRSTNHLYLNELTDALGCPRDIVLPYSGMGWSEKLNPEIPEIKMCLDNAYIDKDEDGDYVAYIPLSLDGMLS